MTVAQARTRGSRRGRFTGIVGSGLSITASLAMVAVGAAVAPAAAAVPAAQVTASDYPTASVTPEDALAYFVLELDEESDQWSQAVALVERAGFADTLEQARNDILQDAAGNDVPLDSILGGEAAVVVTSAAIDAIAEAGDPAAMLLDGDEATPAADTGGGLPDATGAALVLDARAPDTAFAALQSALQDQADETGGAVEAIDYDGVTIEYVPGSTADDADPMAVARVDDFVAVAASPTDLEPIIDTGGGEAALADFGPFQDIQSALADDALLFGFIDGSAAEDAQGALNNLGLPTGLTPSATYTGIQVRADEPGFRLETISTPVDGGPFPPATATYESDLATRVPADALFFLSGAELGENGILDTIGAGLIGLASGGLGGTPATPAPDQDPDAFIAEQYEQAAQLIGVNLQTDLFQQFVGEFGLYMSSEADPATISALFASDVSDPGTVVNALNQIKLLVQGSIGAGGEATTRQIQGSEINTVSAGGPDFPKVEYGVVDDQFVLGVGIASPIDSFVDGNGDSLATDSLYQDVMGTLPTEVNGSLYVSLVQVIPLLQGLAEAEGAGSDDFSIEDADPSCANYDDQALAQEAYDAGEEDTFNLDQDFDGEVCEDFFGAATPEAGDDSTTVTDVDLSAIRAFGLVAYEEDGFRRASGILLIDEAE